MSAGKKTTGRLIALGFLSIGVFLLMQVILPIISFQVWVYTQNVSNEPLISPSNAGRQILGISVENKDNFPAFISSLKRETPAGYDKFSLSIPKIKIDNMDVFVDSNDLSKGLVHLPGAALPGEKGNVFISGHSALSRWLPFSNAPFAKLIDLKKGDQIIMKAASAKFTYEVIDLKIVDPKDLSMLKPPEDQGRYVSLMTCVPPGLNFKRLIVLGKIL